MPRKLWVPLIGSVLSCRVYEAVSGLLRRPRPRWTREGEAGCIGLKEAGGMAFEENQLETRPENIIYNGGRGLLTHAETPPFRRPQHARISRRI